LGWKQAWHDAAGPEKNAMTQKLPTTRRTALTLGTGASFAILTRPARAAITYRLTHPADTFHPVHIEAEKMVQRIAARTNGEVRFTIFPKNALGSPVETAQQTRLGAIDFILLNPANIESMSRTIGVINIPYQFDNYDHAHRTLDRTGRDWISQQLRTAGFQWIANFELGLPRPLQQPPSGEHAG
jgi:TRAP-type C4-dicarboxylate transport system substrate-binding protein